MSATHVTPITPAANSSHRIFRLIAICFLFSGATALIYEVLWARMLGLVFGATTIAISAVLAAFMGGLATGSAFAGGFANKLRNPLRAYALIEIAIGLYALIVPALFRGIDLVYVFIWERFHPGFYGFALSRFLLAAVVLFVPTALMGATLPVLVAAIRGAGDRRSAGVAGFTP
jgi:spermidine synthase